MTGQVCDSIHSSPVGFSRSSFCSKTGCVSVAPTPVAFFRSTLNRTDGLPRPAGMPKLEATVTELLSVAMRDTKMDGQPDQPMLVFSVNDWVQMYLDVNRGGSETDYLLRGNSEHYGHICISGQGGWITVMCTCGCSHNGLRFDAQEWDDFITGVIDGEFDIDQLIAKHMPASHR